MKNQARVCDELADYWLHIDKAKYHLAKAEVHKSRVFRMTGDGKFGRTTLGHVSKKKIKVRAYTRNSYRYIRRGRNV